MEIMNNVCSILIWDSCCQLSHLRDGGQTNKDDIPPEAYSKQAVCSSLHVITHVRNTCILTFLIAGANF